MNLELEFIKAMAFIRLYAMIGLVSFLVLSCIEPIKNPKPFVRAVMIYFSVSLGNQLISNFVSKPLAQDIIAIIGTPLLLIVAVGLWLSHLKAKKS